MEEWRVREGDEGGEEWRSEEGEEWRVKGSDKG